MLGAVLAGVALTACGGDENAASGANGGSSGASGAGGSAGNVGASGNGGATGNGGAAGKGGSVGTGGGGPVTLTNTCDVASSALVDAWTADSHFCMIRYASNVTNARDLLFAPNGDLFVAGGGDVKVLYDSNGDGLSGANERSTFTAVPEGNHGVALTATHLYASSTTTVYRWTYTSGQRTATGNAETVVSGIGTGGHSTRTLLIDSQNRLYVSIGSAGNLDSATGTTPPQSRALIRRYDLGNIPSGGYQVSDGELFAAGLRNEVGINMDSQGRLWGVENGRDNLLGNAHYDNPAEEVNLFDTAKPGRNYGYPFCWSEGLWTGALAKGPGTQHLDSEMPGSFTESSCQDPNIVVPPAFALRAHLAPLDIVEYTGNAYPAEFRGNMFVTSHGSWNRESGQVGHLILRLRMTNGTPSQVDNFLGESNNGNLREGSWGVRPVGIRVDPDGLLTFTDNSTGTVNKIGYKP
jgi:glucose/arabinose dehydrogenase